MLASIKHIEVMFNHKAGIKDETTPIIFTVCTVVWWRYFIFLLYVSNIGHMEIKIISEAKLA